MSVEGRELGWDDSIKQDSQNFESNPGGGLQRNHREI